MRKVKWTIAYLVFFVIALIGVYFGIIKLFSIQEIKVVGSSLGVTVDKRRFPTNLLFFPAERLRTELLNQNPILADVIFEKRYPHTLILTPILRSPVALLTAPTRRVFIDSRGYALSDAGVAPPRLPVITAPVSGIRLGQQLTSTPIQQSLSFIAGVKDIMNVETITIADDGQIRAHGGKLDILFTQSEDIKTILTTLQTLFSGFRIKGTLPTVIDLRFDKPVVKFE